MKFTNLFALLVFCAILPLFSCGSDNAAESATTTEAAPAPADNSTVNPAGAIQAPTPGTDDAAPAPATTQAAAPPSGVKHYTCPKNCKGSGGDAAGTCPVCGTAYVHNQAFHGQEAATPAGATATPVTPPPSPAKNAAGVFHYTCSKGCAGGAGAAGKCATCGGDLAHNAAYHNN